MSRKLLSCSQLFLILSLLIIFCQTLRCLAETLTKEQAKASPAASLSAPTSSALRGEIREYWSLREMGIQCNNANPRVIVRITPGTPAWEQGLSPGDQLLKVEQQGQTAYIDIRRNNKVYRATINYQGQANPAQKISKTDHLLNAKIDQSLVKLSVAHADQLSPLPAGLRVGAEFKKEDLPKCHCGGVWFRIPEWFAGVWRTSDAMAHAKTHYDFQSGLSSESDYQYNFVKIGTLFGVAQDRTGQIWHYPCVPYVGDQIVKDVHYVDMETEQLPIQISADVVILRDRYFDVEVDNNRIKSLYQYESITTYQKQDYSYIKVEDSVKTFASDGTPLYLDTGRYTLNKMHDFEPVYDFLGNNLVEMFMQYLKSNGMNELIPGNK